MSGSIEGYRKLQKFFACIPSNQNNQWCSAIFGLETTVWRWHKFLYSSNQKAKRGFTSIAFTQPEKIPGSWIVWMYDPRNFTSLIHEESAGFDKNIFTSSLLSPDAWNESLQKLKLPSTCKNKRVVSGTLAARKNMSEKIKQLEEKREEKQTNRIDRDENSWKEIQQSLCESP